MVQISKNLVNGIIKLILHQIKQAKIKNQIQIQPNIRLKKTKSSLVIYKILIATKT